MIEIAIFALGLFLYARLCNLEKSIEQLKDDINTGFENIQPPGRIDCIGFTVEQNKENQR